MIDRYQKIKILTKRKYQQIQQLQKNLCQLIPQQQKMIYHPLILPYPQYCKQNKSIANKIIGHYIILDMVLCGAYGSVYKGINDINKNQVTIKVIDLVALSKNSIMGHVTKDFINQELGIMMAHNSDHVVKIYDVYESEELIVVATQFCNGGTLSYQIQCRKKIPEKQALQITKQLIIGLESMRKNNIKFRDIYSQNIMCHNGVYKIVDFTLSIICSSQQNMDKDESLYYRIPQTIKNQKQITKADVWLIGLILYEMLCGKQRSQQMYHQILKKDVFTSMSQLGQKQLSQQVTKLLRGMLKINCQLRISWEYFIHQEIFMYRPELPERYRLIIDLAAALKQIELIQKKQLVLIKKNPVQAIPIAYKQRHLKQLLIERNQDRIAEWAISQHLQCLKSQLIYKDIILNIQKSQMLNFKQRNVIQMMYLLCARSYFNLSYVFNEYQDSKHLIVVNLKKNIQNLYNQVQKKFFYYCQLLKNKENQISAIIKDRYEKFFAKNKIMTKDKFLIGLQNLQYKRQEQIIFTYENYLKQQMQNLKPKSITVKQLLQNYIRINMIEVKQLKEQSFYQKIKQIMLEI